MERKLLGVRAYARYRNVSPNAVRKARDTGRITAAFVKSPGGKSLIDVEVADRLWDANTDAAQQRPELEASPAAAPAPKTSDSSASPEPAKPEVPGPTPAQGPEVAPAEFVLESGEPLPLAAGELKPATNGRPRPVVKPGQDLFGDPITPPTLPDDSKDGPKPGSFADVRVVRERWSGELKRLQVLQVAGELVSAERAREVFFKLARSARDAVLAIPVRVAHDLAAEDDPLKVERRLKKELERALESFDSAPGV